jgi:biopolymer transport protein ExbB/TolQ
LYIPNKTNLRKRKENFRIENGLGNLGIMDISLKIVLVALILLSVVTIILLSIYAVKQRRNRKRTEECARKVMVWTKRVIVSMESNNNNVETSRPENLYV